jgi:hypothetical protein
MDFLGSLVTRSVTTVRAQAASMIQPRIASVFESEGGQGIAEVESIPGAEPVTRSLYRAAPAISTAATQTPAQRQERSPQGPLATAEASVELRRLPEEADRHLVQAAPNEAGAERRQLPVEADRALAEASLTTTPAFEARRQQPDLVEEQADREAAEFVREISVPRTLVVDRAIAQPVELERQSLVAGRATPAARVIASRRQLRSTKAVAETPDRVQEAPSIQVTIGRVEVRATTQAPSAPRRSGPQGMTIDEYLRKRTSGGSR